MKKTGFFFLVNMLLFTACIAQVEKIEDIIQRNEVEAHIRFLASDELRGRDTGSPELEIAARYIAEAFRSYGLKPVTGTDHFFQQVKLVSDAVDSLGPKEILAKNVVAMVEGTDPKMKNEFIILSAHYDHIGVGKHSSGQDSIYNGARDNAVGTTAVLCAAKYFGQHPPRRSVLFIALTAEEKGLLGSAWYAGHPLILLEQMVFNLNTDGAGYNDTAKVTVIGLERTSAEEEIKAASEKFGLTAIPDPVPDQNLYDRSDNFSFAAKGIPAVNFSPGITAFDQEIMSHYHQVSDEAETLNFSYLERFSEAFTLTAKKIANMPKKPFWRAGDKYENAGKDLYGK